MEIAFGKGSQPHELSVVRFQEAKIAGLDFHGDNTGLTSAVA
jgi:hypothetical protein